MRIETNLRGRLRNTTLPKSSGLLPLFEAVVNSIHALEEAQAQPEQGLIRVVIEREPSLLDTDADGAVRGRPASGDVIGFKVIDNGIGFTEANFESFMTLDSEYKAMKGGRGIGRLLWLKAFDQVRVASRFLNESDELKHRSFSFSPSGITDAVVEDPRGEGQRETTVHLLGFEPSYRTLTRKTGDAIAKRDA